MSRKSVIDRAFDVFLRQFDGVDSKFYYLNIDALFLSVPYVYFLILRSWDMVHVWIST